jgi:23S rRNA (uracil1939-C5)-methyltransferase
LGYRRAHSHDLIDIAVCPVLSPRIAISLPKLREALAPLLGGKREAKVSVTETGSGLDIVVEGIKPTPASLGAFVGKAAPLGVARLTADGESIAPGGPPEVDLSGAKVRLPPGAFLQASGAAEAVLAGLVREGVGGAKRLADLFAGLGTFTFALARDAAVDAFEADEAALQALADAARNTPKLKPVRTLSRDLFRAPLSAKELKAYDAVVLDPPRAGASAQAQELARSQVAEARRGLLQPGHFGARPPHSGEWRLPHRPHRARRSVPLLAAHRGHRPPRALNILFVIAGLDPAIHSTSASTR